MLQKERDILEVSMKYMHSRKRMQSSELKGEESNCASFSTITSQVFTTFS